MWDLRTLDLINQKASDQARQGKPERDALFLATGITDPSNPFLDRNEEKVSRSPAYKFLG